MRWRMAIVFLVLSSLAVLYTPGLTRTTGDPLARTGAPVLGAVPAEATCSGTGCHLGNPQNQGGAVEVQGVPSIYVPGNTYELSVRLTSDQTAAFTDRRWGFQITAARLADGIGSGTFEVGSLQLLAGGSRDYVTHNVPNLKTGEASPVTWTFSWTAPPGDAGPIGFYVAGVAGNGDSFASGDFVYTGAETTSTAVPVRSATWGGLKRGFMSGTP